MTKTLEDLVEERKRQAAERQIESKASFVAHNLGTYTGSPSSIFSQYIFKDDEFDISRCYQGHLTTADDRALGSSIQYRGRVVFDVRKREIYSYIPGSWEKKLEKLYKRAQKKIEKVQEATRLAEENKLLAEKEKKEAEIRARFGL